MKEASRDYEMPFGPVGAPPTGARPIEPDPGAHAGILVRLYGLQTAAWIAETNVMTARSNDMPYWSCVLQAVSALRSAESQI